LAITAATVIGRTAKIAGFVVLGVFLLAATTWGVLAIHYSDLEGEGLRTTMAAGFAIAGLAALVALVSSRWRWRMLTGFVPVFAIVVIYWTNIEPSNDRAWQPDVTVLPYATFDGELVTVYNIRNSEYRSETDFHPAYYDRTFDLRELQSVDVIASYWMGPAIAHVFLSFGFGGQDYLAISIETRKEQGEGYSTISGFFKQYELIYVVADERDLIRVRTNFRNESPEQVYLYRVRGRGENARFLFLEYMRKINALKDKPEFYNTLTTNCTGNIWLHTRVNPGHLPFSWKILLSGYVPEYLYEAGRLDMSLPFYELKRRSLVNARAQEADAAEDFSQRIRAGLPLPVP
jgi:Domain of unknown function (DUF4105)